MKNSKLFTMVIATALMFANIACACAPDHSSSESTSVHLHTIDGQDNGGSTQCPHQNCDGCDEMSDDCTTADFGITPIDRDFRTLISQKLDLDNPDLDLAFFGADRTERLAQEFTGMPPRYGATSWPADTPVRRKDQLTE